MDLKFLNLATKPTIVKPIIRLLFRLQIVWVWSPVFYKAPKSKEQEK